MRMIGKRRVPGFQLGGWLALLLLTAASGCGYGLVRADAVPGDVRTLLVRVDAPERSDPLLADDLSRELRAVIRRGGRFRLVESAPADAELLVEITTDRTRAVAFNEFDEVLDYQTTVALDAQLVREGSSLWSAERIAATRGQAAVEGAVVTTSSRFQGTETVSRQALADYDTVQIGEERKVSARAAVMRDLAQTLYTRMTEGL